MLLEILDVFRKAAVEIVESGVSTIGILGKAMFEAFGIVKASAATAGPAELFIVLLIFGAGIYIAYKLFWDSAKTIFYFVILLAALAALFFAMVI